MTHKFSSRHCHIDASFNAHYPCVRICRAVLAVAILLIMLTPSFGYAQSAPASRIEISGTWRGVLGTGAVKLHLVLTITRLDNGEYAGQLNSVDQGAVLPVDSITVQDRKLRFEVKSVAGIYEGVLSESGAEIKGTWVQARVPAQPLSFEHSETSPATANAPKPEAGPETRPFTFPLSVVVPIPPRAFKADGKMHLVYELHVVNMFQWSCTLTGVEIVSNDSAHRSLAKFAGSALEGMIERPGQTVPQKSKLEPGTQAVVFLWVTLDRAEDVPQMVRHQLRAKLGSYAEELTVETAPLAVGSGVAVIAPPLKGDHWASANGPSNISVHRRALIPIDGRAVIAQRFAIDWVRIGNDGNTHHGDPLDNKNYYAYGSEALAVADGIITEVKDGIPANVPNSRAGPITLENVGGNHVVLDIGNGNYAFYAHLQANSIRVKPGDKVRRGQVLGLVGNTGNSSEPHLHFHIANADSPLGAEGLPYAFPSFEIEGRGQGWKPTEAKGPEKHIMEMPLQNVVVRFP